MADLEETLIVSNCLPTHVCFVHSVIYKTLIPSIMWKRRGEVKEVPAWS